VDEVARQEKDLYPAVQKLMESGRYTVICQFKTFFPLIGRTRILDLLGFRWTDDGDLDAWAIEGKQGASPADTLTALGQAIEYQLYVPRVSVAAEDDQPHGERVARKRRPPPSPEHDSRWTQISQD
jgi:hypothetical protein